jgi:hypothetical protein
MKVPNVVCNEFDIVCCIGTISSIQEQKVYNEIISCEIIMYCIFLGCISKVVVLLD